MSARRGRRRNRGASTRGMAKRVRRLEDTAEETKHILFSDIALPGRRAGFAAASVYAGAPQQLYISGLTRGNTVQSRIGDKVVFTSIRFKVQCFFSSALVNQCTVNWFIYRLNAGTVAIAATDILIGIYGTASPTMSSLPDINNRNDQRFTVLKRGNYKHVAPSDASSENQVINIIYRKKVYSEYRFNDLGTIADQNKNALYLLIWADKPGSDPGYINIDCDGHVFFHG